MRDDWKQQALWENDGIHRWDSKAQVMAPGSHEDRLGNDAV
jgi:hypothetical protein